MRIAELHMNLERKRRHYRLGAPDMLAVLLLGTAVLCAALWARSDALPPWERALGAVVECQLVKRAHSVSPDPDQVRLSYEYTVDGRTYRGAWNGFWPQAYSPNALPVSQLDRLRQKGYPLTVFYDPLNPAVNALHRVEDLRPYYYRWFLFGGLAAILLYFCGLYPRWKRRA